MQNIKKCMALLLAFVLVLSLVLPYSAVPTEAATTSQISDIAKTNSKYKAAKWAVDGGYLQLLPGNRFQAGTLVMEWQMLQFIAKLDKNFHFDLNGKSQQDVQDILYEYYGELNIPLYGVTNKQKRVANISRGHFAKLYAAMNGLDLSEIQAVRYLYMGEITTGTTGKKTYEDYAPSRNINRGDLSVFMYRVNQQGKLAIEGLQGSATGKDDSKITLPPNFVESKDTTVTIPEKPGQSTNDKENRPSIYDAVKEIDVQKEELTANGVDSTLISIDLRDSYGNDISYDESLAFRVTSEAGAKISETGTNTSEEATIVYTDGPELNVFVTAPTVTKSVVDKIRFEMINPTEKYHTYKGQVIETSVRYVPKAELRVTYEVYDPEQTEWQTPVQPPAPKPLPALPSGVVETTTVPFTEKGIITITEFDEDYKLMTGTKWEAYTTSQGVLTQGDVKSDEIQYGNAELKLEGQEISVWLFEQILYYMIEGDANDPWGGIGSAKVMYTINKDGRASYDLQGVISEEYSKQFDSMLHTVIIYLTEKFLPIADEVTLAHEETVNIIKAMYDRLGQVDKNILQEQRADLIGKLQGAASKIDVLLVGKELQERPDGLDRYTKVIVNLVAPSGVIITDYRGTVRVTYNGKSQLVSFDNNTKDYNNGTGSAGSAVVYFDDLIYGKSEVKLELVDIDTRYDKVIETLKGKTVTAPIFANQRFETNMCSKDTEVMFLVDHSGSIKSRDKQNHMAVKVKQMVTQLNANPTHVYRFNNEARFEAKGTAKEVTDIDSLLQYQKESRSTNIVKTLRTAIDNFSSGPYTNKAIVLITDGRSSSNGLESVLTEAKSKGIKIHTISVGSYKKVNERLLKDISAQTGGSYQNVNEIENIHGAMQAVITAILCHTEVINNSCLNPDAMFNHTNVTNRSNRVLVEAQVNTSCDNIAAIRVVFNSPDGSYTLDLNAGGAGKFTLRSSLNEFLDFELYTDVEFQALDAKGNVIAMKIHNM